MENWQSLVDPALWNLALLVSEETLQTRQVPLKVQL